MKRKIVAAAASLATLASLLVPELALAATPEPTSPATSRSLNTMRDVLSNHHVPTGTQDRLINTWLAGGTWESSSSENIPVSTQVEEGDDSIETVNTYADGSINVLRQEKPQTASNGRAISGCSQSGTAYSHCRVDFWWGVVSMSFVADYNLQNGNNRITNQYAAAWSIGGACGTYKNYFGRPNSRLARLEVQAQMCLVPHSQTFWLQLALSGNKASFTFG